MKNLIFIIFCLFLHTDSKAQCAPASSPSCDEVGCIFLCSADELNGYSCTNVNYSNPTGCSPLCSNGGQSTNTEWWSFVTAGGNVCFTFISSNCSVNGNGIQFGLWGDCNCSSSIFCESNCSGPGTKTVCSTLQPCKIYYLFVNGCSGDVCDYKILTSGGNAPFLDELKTIDGPTELYAGTDGVKYCGKFKNNSSSCNPSWRWTLDGEEINCLTECVDLDFPNEGEFLLCVSGYIGNPATGQICDEEGPICKLIKVLNLNPEPKCPNSKFITSAGSITTSSVDENFPKNTIHIWNVIGGKIITMFPQNQDEIQILWDYNPDLIAEKKGTVCYHYLTNNVHSQTCCKEIILLSKTNAGSDIMIPGYRYKLNAESLLSGEWTVVSGPGSAKFSNKMDPKTQVRISKYGTYVFKWSLTSNKNIQDYVTVTFITVNSKTTHRNLFDTCCQESIDQNLTNRSVYKKYTLFPNPVSHKRIVIEGGDVDCEDNLAIYDLYGKQVHNTTLDWKSTQIEIDLSETILRGVYILKIENKDGTQLVEKMVIE